VEGEKGYDPVRLESEDVKKVLSKAKKENESGVPAMVEFIIDPWDFPDGFKEFQPKPFK
jgi:hypothetical protein